MDYLLALWAVENNQPANLTATGKAANNNKRNDDVTLPRRVIFMTRCDKIFYHRQCFECPGRTFLSSPKETTTEI